MLFLAYIVYYFISTFRMYTFVPHAYVKENVVPTWAALKVHLILLVKRMLVSQSNNVGRPLV